MSVQTVTNHDLCCLCALLSHLNSRMKGYYHTIAKLIASISTEAIYIEYAMQPTEVCMHIRVLVETSKVLYVHSLLSMNTV